jgi:hypothetical protein
MMFERALLLATDATDGFRLAGGEAGEIGQWCSDRGFGFDFGLLDSVGCCRLTAFTVPLGYCGSGAGSGNGLVFTTAPNAVEGMADGAEDVFLPRNVFSGMSSKSSSS